MKRTFILPVIALLALAITFTSCKPSRVWATKKKEHKEEYREPERYSRPAPPPPRYSYVSLIITPSPGFVMKQNPNNGRFYHRSPDGFLYWKGYDNRFYLDRSQISRVSYNKWEYDEWKRYSRASG